MSPNPSEQNKSDAPRPRGCTCRPKPLAVPKVKTVVRHNESGRPYTIQKVGPYVI